MMVKKIKDNLDTARKEKSPTVAFLATLYAEVVNVGKNNGNRKTTDEEAMAVLKKMRKSNEETLKYAANEKLELENKIIDSFLPKQLSENELSTVINSMIEAGANNIGAIMKQLKSDYSGQYDGKMASMLIKKLL